MAASTRKINVLMVGAGEYNCGYVPKKDAAPDKKAGVTAVVLFDLRRRGKLGRILLCDAQGTRLPAARACMAEKIGAVYKDMDLTLECFPGDEVPFDTTAYRTAMDSMVPGDAVIVFTPDDTHGPITSYALSKGLHVLVAKPLVKTLLEHLELEAAAARAGLVLAVEYHKRWDPIYNDAVQRMQALGPFSYYHSCMTQRREQLDTFAGWAGKSSDISYYLNSHHIDIHCWAMTGRGVPVQVTAAASTGVANSRLGRGGIEDTITLLVQWDNHDGTTGHAVYMSSWSAPTADCHTQQGFHYMGHKGEMRADQAHRGYSMSADGDAGGTGALAALNPLYMRYTPDARGYFAGQQGYGYRSIEAFVQCVQDMCDGSLSCCQVEEGGLLATARATLPVTAILQAGRLSLDAGGQPVRILYADRKAGMPTGLQLLTPAAASL